MKALPAAEPARARGIMRQAKDSFVLPARINCTELTILPQAAANLFVPIARLGGSPIASSIGRDTRPPPPAMESIKPTNTPPMPHSSKDRAVLPISIMSCRPPFHKRPAPAESGRSAWPATNRPDGIPKPRTSCGPAYYASMYRGARRRSPCG